MTCARQVMRRCGQDQDQGARRKRYAVVIRGLVTSTLMMLLVLPVLYRRFEKKRILTKNDLHGIDE